MTRMLLFLFCGAHASTLKQKQKHTQTVMSGGNYQQLSERVSREEAAVELLGAYNQALADGWFLRLHLRTGLLVLFPPPKAPSSLSSSTAALSSSPPQRDNAPPPASTALPRSSSFDDNIGVATTTSPPPAKGTALVPAKSTLPSLSMGRIEIINGQRIILINDFYIRYLPGRRVRLHDTLLKL